MGWQTLGHPQLMLSVVLHRALYLWQHLVQSFTHQARRFLKKPWWYYLYWQLVKRLCVIKNDQRLCSSPQQSVLTSFSSIFWVTWSISASFTSLFSGAVGPIRTLPELQRAPQGTQGPISLGPKWMSTFITERWEYEEWPSFWSREVRMNCRNRRQVNFPWISLLLVWYQQFDAI